jgi:hypothetical protein
MGGILDASPALGLRVSDDDDDDDEDLRLASRFRGEEGDLPTYLTYVFRLGVWKLSLLQVSVLSCYRRQVFEVWLRFYRCIYEGSGLPCVWGANEA